MITEPAHVVLWQYGAALTTDWSVGSAIRFTTPWEDTTFEQWGTVLAFDPPTALRYSLFSPRPGLEDLPGNYFTMSYTLRADGAATILEIVQEDPREIEGGPADPEEPDAEHPVLTALKQLAESQHATGRHL